MSDQPLSRREKRFSLPFFITLMMFFTGLLLASIYPASATQRQSPFSMPVHQQGWPTVGVGAGYMRFEHLSIQDGLSNNAVSAIWQDSLGYLWFGTREGLNKYDGYTTTVYTAGFNTPGTLSDSFITALAETSDGSLWVGTRDGGLNRLDPKTNRFEQVNLIEEAFSESETHIKTLLVDSQNRLWVGTAHGLVRLEPDDELVFGFRHDPNDEASLSNDAIQSLFKDSEGRLWIGTTNGLNRFENDGTFTRYLTGVSSGVSVVTSITEEADGNLWFGSLGGLIKFDPKQGTYRVFRHNPNDPNSLSSNQINTLKRDRSGRLWIGFDDQGVGLLTDFSDDEIKVKSFQHKNFDPQSLSSNAVRTIFEDAGGLLWFGTEGGGVNKANPRTRKFGYYQHEPGNSNSLAGENITALAFDGDRRSLWIGTAGMGLNRMDLATGEFLHYLHDPQDKNSLDGDYITLLYIGPRGTLYVETQGGRLEYYEPAVDGFLPAFSNQVNYRRGSRTTAITHDSQGIIWLSQADGQLLKIDPVGEEIFQYDLALKAPEPAQEMEIIAIFADPEEILWLATTKQGLIRFDPQQGSFTTHSMQGNQPEPSHQALNSIHPARNGVLWLGTAGGGLIRFNPATGLFTSFTTEVGLPSNQVFGILEDVNENLWMSTGNGLVRFEPSSETFHTFDALDGLQGNTFNPRAFAAGSGGAMFFGGVDGFNAFYPDLIDKNTHEPPLVIKQVMLFNKSLARDLTGCEVSLTLTHDQNFLSFEFAALDYTSPGANTYAYWMEGLEDDFVQAGRKRVADYPNLPWGNYIFRLIGANNDGVWNNQETCLFIEIQPPFWAAWWFILLVGLFLAGAVILGYQWRSRALEKNQQNLVVQVFERTMEIERRRQMASGLSEVIRLINSNQPLNNSLDFIVQQSVGLTSASKAAIFERVEDQVHARVCYPQGETYPVDLTDPNSSSARCLLETTFLNRLLIFSRVDPTTLRSDTNWELVSGEYRTILCTPLLVNDEVYGGLVLYYGEDRIFTPEEISLAHTLADQASLAIANARLKDEAQDAAVIAERNRLARDLHDAVTQTLFSTSLIAEVLPKIWARNPEKAQARLDELRQLARGALGEMRTLLMELRPSAMKDADPVELFKHLTEAFTGRTGILVDFSVEGSADCHMPEEVKLAFYRIAQEGLNNVAKHAEAEKVSFRFNCDSGAETLTITDDGQGFARELIPGGHLGLEIMKERAESIGADLTIVSQPGEGTTLRLTWRFNQDALK